MKASDLFVRQLEEEGVQYIFGVPGEENLDFIESLRTSKITLIVTRHEQEAGFMAATFGRLKGEPGVCLCTLGPGATNVVTAAAYAQLGGMPMVIITGQKPIKNSKQGQFQMVDVVQMMHPLTKQAVQVASGDRIPSIVRNAFRLAREERPGAVHIELPEDIAAEEVEGTVLPREGHSSSSADERAIEKACTMIKEATMPLLLIGAGANRQETSEALQSFVDTTGIYFFNTQMGKGVLDERHPHFLGTAALSGNDYLHCAIDRADLIINVGHDVIEKPPFIMEKSDRRQVIHINYFSADVDQIYFPQHEVVGDIAVSLEKLARCASKSDADMSYFERIKKEVEIHIAEGSDDDRFPLLPQKLVATVQSVMPDDGILALDNGMYKIWFARNYKAAGRNTVLLDNALATMGAGLPSAVATKMIHPERKVVAVCGDGGFLMNSQALQTAVSLKLNLVVLVLNDSAFGMIKWKQEGMDLPNFGLDLENPDFKLLAEAYGAVGHTVSASADLASILKHAFDATGVHLIEVPIDYSENHKVLTEELKEKTCIL